MSLEKLHNIPSDKKLNCAYAPSLSKTYYQSHNPLLHCQSITPCLLQHPSGGNRKHWDGFMLNPPSLFATVFSIVFLSHQCGKGNARVATLSDSIDCSELNWDHGLVTVVPVSFMGVDSLDETRFCFSLGRPSLLRLFVAQLLLLSQPQLHPPLPESHPPCFLCPSTRKRKREGATHCPIRLIALS